MRSSKYNNLKYVSSYQRGVKKGYSNSDRFHVFDFDKNLNYDVSYYNERNSFSIRTVYFKDQNSSPVLLPKSRDWYVAARTYSSVNYQNKPTPEQIVNMLSSRDPYNPNLFQHLYGTKLKSLAHPCGTQTHLGNDYDNIHYYLEQIGKNPNTADYVLHSEWVKTPNNYAIIFNLHHETYIADYLTVMPILILDAREKKHTSYTCWVIGNFATNIIDYITDNPNSVNKVLKPILNNSLQQRASGCWVYQFNGGEKDPDLGPIYYARTIGSYYSQYTYFFHNVDIQSSFNRYIYNHWLIPNMARLDPGFYIVLCPNGMFPGTHYGSSSAVVGGAYVEHTLNYHDLWLFNSYKLSDTINTPGGYLNSQQPY